MAQIVKKDVRYLNKDFGQFRQSLIEFTKAYFPNTYNDFNESSPGMMLMELAAYVGDVLSYYADDQLKESLLAYAQEYENVNNIANVLGYKVKNKIPATVTLDVFQLLPAKNVSGSKVPDWTYSLTIPAGAVIRSTFNNTEFRTVDLINFSTSGSNNPTELSVYQVNDVDNTPEFYLLKKQVQAVAGQLQTRTFTFTTPKRFDKITIPVTDAIQVLSIVDSDNNTWTEVPYLAQDTVFEAVSNVIQNDPELYTYADSVPYLLKLRKTSRRFVTRFNAERQLEIQFGAGLTETADEELIPNPDNVGMSLIGLQKQFDVPIDPSNFMYTKAYGLAPSNTTLTVTYTTGGGLSSNVPAFTINQLVTISYQIEDSTLNAGLVDRIKASVAFTNPTPSAGGKEEESIDEVRQNALANFASQRRAVTDQDYIVRAYSLPVQFGSVSKAYIIQDSQLNPANTYQYIPNPLALNLYTLGYDGNGNLTPLNNAIKQNLRSYMSQYRMLTDAINIKDAFIINIGIKFDIITLPGYNSYDVLVECINKLKSIFDIKKWQINQPILLSKLYTELDRVEGVQTVIEVDIVNLYDTDSGYSGNIYSIPEATKNGVIYPSLDPSIFEVKYPNKDIIGKVTPL